MPDPEKPWIDPSLRKFLDRVTDAAVRVHLPDRTKNALYPIRVDDAEDGSPEERPKPVRDDEVGNFLVHWRRPRRDE